jgi:ABC-2 type transport system permease protein
VAAAPSAVEVRVLTCDEYRAPVDQARGSMSMVYAFGLLLLIRLAFLWIGIFLGLKARSPEMANSIFGLLYPVTMLSNAFVATELMPGWIGSVAEWNPLSATISATRELFGNPGVSGGWTGEHAIVLAVAWPLVITALTLPLAVRAFQRLSR